MLVIYCNFLLEAVYSVQHAEGEPSTNGDGFRASILTLISGSLFTFDSEFSSLSRTGGRASV